MTVDIKRKRGHHSPNFASDKKLQLVYFFGSTQTVPMFLIIIVAAVVIKDLTCIDFK